MRSFSLRLPRERLFPAPLPPPVQKMSSRHLASDRPCGRLRRPASNEFFTLHLPWSIPPSYDWRSLHWASPKGWMKASGNGNSFLGTSFAAARRQR